MKTFRLILQMCLVAMVSSTSMNTASMSKPGSIGLVLNTTSIEGFLTTFLPNITSNMLLNRTFQIDYYDSSSYFYNLTLDTLQVKSLTSAPPILDVVNGTK